jgi:hypothetical protein
MLILVLCVPNPWTTPARDIGELILIGGGIGFVLQQ